MTSHRILLTGANGFLGSHILKQLLPRDNVSVRVVVRSNSKIDAVKRDFGNYKNLDFAVVPDITSEDAFHDALTKTDAPFDTVIHSASPFLYTEVKDNLEFLHPAIKGTTEILKNVKAVAPSVKRMIITSSFAAIGNLTNPEQMRNKVMTDADWNPVTWEQALNGNQGVGYQASKKFAEEAAWTFVKEEKPNFDIVTICPPMIYGPPVHTVKKTSDLNASTSRIYNSFINSKKDAELPPNGLHLYVDPREVAAAHIAAIFTPEAGANRFLVSAGQVSSQKISDTLRAAFPELEERTPMGNPGTNSLAEGAFDSDSSKAKKILGIRFRSIESTFEDLGAWLLALEKREKEEAKN